MHLRHDIVVARVVLHRLRLAEHVHQHDPGPGARDGLEERAVPTPAMSLTTLAPASSAALATSGFARVDAQGVPGRAFASPSITGTTRRSSSSTSMGSEPGRVDSPPTSTRSAPSSTSRAPWATASSALANMRAVAERVRRDVHDAHHQRAFAEAQCVVTAPPDAFVHTAIVEGCERERRGRATDLRDRCPPERSVPRP